MKRGRSDEVCFATEDWLDQRADVFGVELAVGVDRDDDVGADFCGLGNARTKGRADAARFFVSDDNGAFGTGKISGRICGSVVHDDRLYGGNAIDVARNALQNVGNGFLFVEGRQLDNQFHLLIALLGVCAKRSDLYRGSGNGGEGRSGGESVSACGGSSLRFDSVQGSGIPTPAISRREVVMPHRWTDPHPLAVSRGERKEVRGFFIRIRTVATSPLLPRIRLPTARQCGVTRADFRWPKLLSDGF